MPSLSVATPPTSIQERTGHIGYDRIHEVAHWSKWSQSTACRLSSVNQHAITAYEAKRKLQYYTSIEGVTTKQNNGHSSFEHLGSLVNFFDDLFKEQANFHTLVSRFLLVDQLLNKEQRGHSKILLDRLKTRGATHSAKPSKNLLLASQLLHHLHLQTVALHAPISLSTNAFVATLLAQSMQQQNGLNSTSPPITVSAKQLAAAFDALQQAVAATFEQANGIMQQQRGSRKFLTIWKFLQAQQELQNLYRQFEHCWISFTQLQLKERLYNLLKLPKQEIEQRLEASHRAWSETAPALQRQEELLSTATH